MKPLSVTLPFAARFTDGGDNEPRAKRIENQAKAKSVTAAEVQEGDAGALFDLAPKSRLGVGPVSSKWGVTTDVKKAKTNNLTNIPFN